MPKNHSILPVVPIAGNRNSPIECVPSADSTEDALSTPAKAKTNNPLIGIDLLGGDHYSSEFLLKTVECLVKKPGLSCSFCFFLPDNHRVILEDFAKTRADLFASCWVWPVAIDQIVGMDEDPLVAIRRKKHSPMAIAMNLIKTNKLDAFVCNGNTGALVGLATVQLPLLPSIQRPALIALLPTKKKPVAVIDVGANVHCSPEQLMQFAKLGASYQQSRGIAFPNIGLLNIGTEEKKGRSELRETYKLLQKTYPKSTKSPTFIGNIEGKEVFTGSVDVLVTDGFTGNVFLKTAEGISSFILTTCQQNEHLLPIKNFLLDEVKSGLFDAKYHGAFLAGVDGIVIKCHGDAEPIAIRAGAISALDAMSRQVLSRFKRSCSL